MNKSLMMVIAALLVIVGLVMSGYNNLVEMNENVNGKWSQIENQLQRRNDLIPNLVNTVKGYAAHESDVFKAVADARAKLGGEAMPHTKAMCLRLLPMRVPNWAVRRALPKQAKQTANFPAHSAAC